MRRRHLLAAAATMLAGRGAQAFPVFGEPAQLPPLTDAIAKTMVPSQVAFVRAILANSAALFSVSDKEGEKAAWQKTWADVAQSKSGEPTNWNGRLLASGCSMSGCAPVISIWPGIVLRADAGTEFERPASYIAYSNPLYRQILPVPVGGLLSLSGKMLSGRLDGAGPYPYPISIQTAFTAFGQPT
jgi:hypothetical protein